jgi:hypothetical protein
MRRAISFTDGAEQQKVSRLPTLPSKSTNHSNSKFLQIAKSSNWQETSLS